MSFTVTDSLERMLQQAEGLELQLKLNIVTSMEKFGRIATEEMIMEHSFQNRTGRLERSIGYHIETPNPGHTELHMYALAPYAQAVEEGVPSHSRPYPFFWPVFFKHWQAFYDDLSESILSAPDDAALTGRV